MFKSSVILFCILFCFNFDLQLFDLPMGEPKTPHFHDFGIFGISRRVPIISIFGDTKIPGQIKKRPGVFFEHIMFTSFKKLNPQVCQVWKRRAPKNDEGPSNNILKVLDMGSISIKKHEIEIW